VGRSRSSPGRAEGVGRYGAYMIHLFALSRATH
jgi:hypothetical protein